MEGTRVQGSCREAVSASLVPRIQGSADVPGKAKYWMLTVLDRMSAGESCGCFYEKQPTLPKRDSAMSRQRETMRFGQTLLLLTCQGEAISRGAN